MQNAPERVKEVIKELPIDNVEYIEISDESRNILANLNQFVCSFAELSFILFESILFNIVPKNIKKPKP